MDDQNQVDAVAADESDDASSERYSSGHAKLDAVVYKVDAGVRRISQEIHSPAPPADPDRPRVSSGIEPLDNAVYKIDGTVRSISKGLHKAVDSVTKKS
jgi:hypothetical protein